MSGYEDGDILFLQLAVKFKMKNKNERNRINIEYRNSIHQFKKNENNLQGAFFR